MRMKNETRARWRNGHPFLSADGQRPSSASARERFGGSWATAERQSAGTAGISTI